MATDPVLDIGAALLAPDLRSEQVTQWFDAHLPGHTTDGYPDLWVPPTMVALTARAQERGFTVGSTAGFPTGQHEPLIKAAEARFAVQHGASAIALCVPAESRGDPNRALMEAVTVREAVPSPVKLCVILGGEEEEWPALIECYRRAGVDAVVLPLSVPGLPSARPADAAGASGEIPPRVRESARGMDVGAFQVMSDA